MGRILKWVIGIVAALIIVLVVAVYVILSRYDFNDLKPQIAKAAQEATGRELTIGGDIDFKIGFTPSLVLTDIKFQNAPWGSRPEMVKLERFEVQVAILPLIGGNIEIKRFILVSPDILIETDKSGKSNLAFESSKKAALKKDEGKPSGGMPALPALSFNKLEIRSGKLTYRDGKSGKTTNVNLNLLTASATGVDSPMEFRLKGGFDLAGFDLTGTLGPLESLTDPKKAWPLKISANAFNASVTLDGSVKDVLAQHGIDIGFRIQVQDWTKLSQLAGKPIPIKEPLDISGRVGDTGPKAYKISDLKIALGSNTIGGSVGINLAKETPYMDVILSSKNLDLRSFFPEDKGKEKSEKRVDEPAQKREKVFPNDPLPLDGLKQVNGDFKIRITKILMPQLVVNNLSVNTTMKDGQLDVKPLKATFGGGALNGSVSLKPRGKVANITTLLKVDGFELGSMLKELGITELIEGSLDVDVNLKGQGTSVASIMAGLNGHTSVIMSQGRINNKYIDLLGGDIGGSVFRLLNPAKEKKDYTAIKCMVSRFDIKTGLADSTALVVDTDRMSVVGEGKIDLKTEKLDLALKPLPKGGVGGFSLSLGELAKPFKLGGTLAKPSLAIDPTQAALALGKTVGGIALFGPVGIAAALVGKSKGGDENPCLAAIEAAKTGVKSSKKKKTVEKKDEPKKPADAVKDAIPDVGKALKGLFGR
ncbi:AsmA family protein [Thermodesulfobacteriota bacterium]